MSEIVVIDKEELPKVLRQVIVTLVNEIRSEPPKPDIMTKKEVAEYLRCDISKINRFMKSDLPFVMFGDTPRFYRSDVDNWLKNK